MTDLQAELAYLLRADARYTDYAALLASVANLQQSDLNLKVLYEMIGISAQDCYQAFSEFKYWLANQLEQMNNGLFIKYEDYDYYQALKQGQTAPPPLMEAASSQMQIEEVQARVSDIAKILELQDLTLSESLAQLHEFAEYYAENTRNKHFIENSEYNALIAAQEELLAARAAAYNGAKSQEALLERNRYLDVEIERVRGEYGAYKALYDDLLRNSGVQSADELICMITSLKEESLALKERQIKQLALQYKTRLIMRRMQIQNYKLMHILAVHNAADVAPAVIALLTKIQSLLDSNSSLYRRLTQYLDEQSYIRLFLALEDATPLFQQIEGVFDHLNARLADSRITCKQQLAFSQALERQVAQLEAKVAEKDNRLIDLQRTSDGIIERLEGHFDSKKKENYQLQYRLRVQQVSFQSSVSQLHDLARLLKAFKAEAAHVKMQMYEEQQYLFEEQHYLLDGAFLSLFEQLARSRQQMQEKDLIQKQLVQKYTSYQELVAELATEKQVIKYLAADKEKMAALLADHEYTIANYVYEIEALREQAEAQIEAFAACDQQLKTVTASNNELQCVLLAQKNDFERARQYIINTEQLIKRNSALQEQNTQLASRLELTESELSKTQESCLNYSKQFQRMQSLVDSAQHSNAKLVFDLYRTVYLSEKQECTSDGLDKLCDHFRIPRAEVYQYIQAFTQTIERQKSYLIDGKAQESRLKSYITQLTDRCAELSDKLQRMVAKELVPQPEMQAMRRRLQGEIAQLNSELDAYRASSDALTHQLSMEKQYLYTRVARLEKDLALRRGANLKISRTTADAALQTHAGAKDIDIIALFDFSAEIPPKASSRTRFCRKLLEQAANEKLPGKERLESFLQLIYAIKATVAVQSEQALTLSASSK